MSLLGSVKAFSMLIDASDTTIPISGTPLEIAVIDRDVTSIEVFNTSGEMLELLEGADEDLKRICIIPGFAEGLGVLERQPVALPSRLRLSIRSLGNAPVGTGLIAINAWV